MKSMTGFGKATEQNDRYHVDVELKSVNQRFLDINLRMPKEVNPHEMAIRQVIKDALYRGRVEGYITIKEFGAGNKNVLVHWPLIHQLIDEIQEQVETTYDSKRFDATQTINQLLTNPDYVEIVESQEVDESFSSLILETVEQAVAKINQSRLQEGQKIQQVLLEYSQEVSDLVENLGRFTEFYEKEFREKFEAKLTAWLGAQVEEARLLTEMVILLEKADIHEELDRLGIHLEKLNELLLKEGPAGRELDFLIQEINREVNTIGSKSSAIEIKTIVVQLKTILEKIREQIQNIE
ncbi:YicC/YloC family endoribonuclease [Enterococcus sp. LJL99]